MLITLPFSPPDQALALKLAEWIVALGSYPLHSILLVADDRCAVMGSVLTKTLTPHFASVASITVKDSWNKWPESPNAMFAAAARYIEDRRSAPYWLWIEADTVPTRSTWLDELEAAHRAAKKPFTGAFVHVPELPDVPDHMSGVGIYPVNMSAHAGVALIATDIAWDVEACKAIVPQMNATRLIHHAWKRPPFESLSEFRANVGNECVLFHADKSGSLIDMLRGENNLPVPVLAEPSKDLGAGAATTAKAAIESKSTGEARESTDTARLLSTADSRGGQLICDILIKSYPADYELLKYCLRGIEKFATGFRKVVLVVPKGEAPGALPPAGIPIQTIEVTENGDGYLFQQAVKANAHEFTDADFILHLDCDTLLSRPVTPESFMRNGKPLWLITPYESIEVPWQRFTEKFIGSVVAFEFMRRLPILIPRQLHLGVAAFCLAKHGSRLTDYILSQPRREFSEFNALGALAYARSHDDFSWLDTTKEESETAALQVWSHDPFDEIRDKFEMILNPPFDASAIRRTKEGHWIIAGDTHLSRWVEESGRLDHDQNTLPLILPHIPVGGIVIDCGANIGTHTAAYLEKVGPTGKVMAIEANLLAWDCLQRNCPSAAIRRVAAWNTNGSKVRLVESQNSGAGYLVEDPDGDIGTSTIDALVIKRLNWKKRVDFIKIDCEGCELRILQGAEKVIAASRPVLFLEVNAGALQRQGHTPQHLFDWLEARGYDKTVVPAGLSLSSPQFDILCEPRITPQMPTLDSVVPWKNKAESEAEISRLARELKKFCTAPHSIRTLRELLAEEGVFSKRLRKSRKGK